MWSFAMLDLSVLTSLTKSHERPMSWWLTRECYGSGLVKGLYVRSLGGEADQQKPATTGWRI